MADRSGPGARAFLAGRTAADVRDTMVEGESGLLATAKPWNKVTYQPSKRRVVWQSGLTASCFSSEQPDQARGPQSHFGWGDEVAAWQYQWEFWSNLMLGLRLGQRPRWVGTTTPRPTRLIKHLVAQHGGDTYVQGGTTYDNLGNLAPEFRRQILSAYEGTRLGKQELLGEVLADFPGALIKAAWFEIPGFRVGAANVPEFRRVVIGVDPAATSGEGAANTGIIGTGMGVDDEIYVLRDSTVRETPLRWAAAAILAYRELLADRIVAEVNNGGEMVISTIHNVDSRVPVVGVRATRGKQTRAEPVAALYEQKRVHHVGIFKELEDEITTWDPNGKMPSPDRLDALVWSIYDLTGGAAAIDVDAGAVLAASPSKLNEYDLEEDY